MSIKLLHKAKIVLWDFDGVVKDSVDVKTEAFVQLFSTYGSAEYINRVKCHHEYHGGLSRFAKIPLYLQWAGEEPTPELVQKLCLQFASLVLDGVIRSPWVPGAENYLRSNHYGQIFLLISATPQKELEQILDVLYLHECFSAVFGVPMNKKEAIHRVLEQYMVLSTDCLMVGDAIVDMNAALANGVPFLLRRHRTNADVFAQYVGPSIQDFRV